MYPSRCAIAIVVAGISATLPLGGTHADCPQDLNELSALLEKGQPRAPINTARDQLRNLHDAARRLQDSGDAVGCARVAQQGLEIWRRAAAVDLAPVDAVTGLRVVDSQGRKVGSISSLIVDVASGQVVFAVVRTGGFLGIRGASYAVPWKAIARKPGADSVTLSVPRQRLHTAPRFDRDTWHEVAPSDWAASIFAYFGIEPYWETATRATSEARQAEMQAIATRLDAIAKSVQDLQNASDQRRQADQAALKQLGERIDEMSSRIDRVEAAQSSSRGPSTPQAATPNTPESSSGTATPESAPAQ